MIRFYTLLIIAIPLFSNFNVLEIRALYHLAITDKEIAQQLDKMLSGNQLQTPIEQGFRGANKMVLAKHALVPNQKYTYFMAGKELLDDAILKDDKNLELRYLRYTIQLNTPSFMGYRKNIEVDRKYLIEQTNREVDKDLKSKIITFLVLKANLNESERKRLQ